MAPLPDLRRLGNVLLGIKDAPWNHALFMSLDEAWAEATPAAIIDPRSLEHDPDPAIMVFIEQYDLDQIMTVADVQDIVSNTEDQLASVEAEDLIEALVFYYDNDAFIDGSIKIILTSSLLLNGLPLTHLYI